MDQIHKNELSDLVKEHTASLRGAFRKYLDKMKIKDGTLTHEQLGKVLRSLGMNPTEAEVLEMVFKYDFNGNGKIDEDEFVFVMMEKTRVHDSKDDIMQIFKLFDKDGNGVIDTMELRGMFQYAMGSGTQVTQDEITELFQELDVNHDGQLNYEEFAKIFALPIDTDEPVVESDTEISEQEQPAKTRKLSQQSSKEKKKKQQKAVYFDV